MSNRHIGMWKDEKENKNIIEENVPYLNKEKTCYWTVFDLDRKVRY